MEFLRDLFGNFASGIIRLAVTVGVLAAAYLFIVKPILHTTEHVTDSVNDSINKSVESANIQIKHAFGPHSQAARSLRQARRRAHKADPGSNSDKLLACVQA